MYLVTEEENLEDDNNHGQQRDGDHGDGDPHVIQEHLQCNHNHHHHSLHHHHHLSLLGPHDGIILLLGDTLHLVGQQLIQGL